MAVNLEAWNATLNHVRNRLRLAESHLSLLAEQISEQTEVANALRDELKRLEQLDGDLTALLTLRGEERA